MKVQIRGTVLRILGRKSGRSDHRIQIRLILSDLKMMVMDRRGCAMSCLILLRVISQGIHCIRFPAQEGPLRHWQRKNDYQPLQEAATEGLDAAAVRGSPCVCTSPFALNLGGAMACFAQIVPSAKRPTTDDAWWMRRVVDGTPRSYLHHRRPRVQWPGQNKARSLVSA